MTLKKHTGWAAIVIAVASPVASFAMDFDNGDKAFIPDSLNQQTAHEKLLEEQAKSHQRVLEEQAASHKRMLEEQAASERLKNEQEEERQRQLEAVNNLFTHAMAILAPTPVLTLEDFLNDPVKFNQSQNNTPLTHTNHLTNHLQFLTR